MSEPRTDFATGLLAFGAHPDDIEFGCGGIIAREVEDGCSVRFVVCSRGEAGTNGTPTIREAEARRAADILGAGLDWVTLDGDARLERRAAHAVVLASMIRLARPRVVLAPTLVENQHPDHWRLGSLVRDAARLARYGGVVDPRGLPPHGIGALFFYAVTPEAEPTDRLPVLVDVSLPAVLDRWRAAMEAHASQMATRSYAELQLARTRMWGMRAGVDHAQALYPNDPPLVDSLAAFGRAARRF